MKLATDLELESGLKPHARVVISGYYGFNNLGDELILKVLVTHLKERDVFVTVLSNNPKQTAKDLDVHAIRRTSLIDIIDALSQAHLLISGGGGLFQDATGPMSAIYYGGLIHLAGFFEVPTFFWAQGVGPLRSNLARKLTGAALKKCKMVTVRDEESAELVQTLSGKYPEVTGDPVWLLKTNRKKKPSVRKRKKGPFSDPSSKQKEETWTIGISLRPWHLLTETRQQALADFLINFAKEADRPIHFLMLPFQVKDDRPLLEALQKRLLDANAGTCEMVDETDVENRIGDCNVLFGMRLHSLVLGLLHGVAVYGLIYDPKVDALLKYFRLVGTEIENIEEMNVVTILHYLIHYPEVDLSYLQRDARKNFKLLDKMLKLEPVEMV